MGKKRNIFAALCFGIIACMGFWGWSAPTSSASSTENDTFYVETCVLPIPTESSTHRNFAPSHIYHQEQLSRAANAPATSTINVTYNGNWDQDAIIAFEFAVSIWESHISSPVPIEVSATWSSLGGNILGSAGPRFSSGRSSLGLDPNLFYPVSLINAQAGSDLFPTSVDINATLNSSYPRWYFGTDGNPASFQTDFVSVVLHELGHGLGFLGTASIDGNGLGDITGGFALPLIYDSFNEDINGVPLVNYGNNSAQLANILRTDVFFDGPQGRAANGNQRVPLYSPSTFRQGSSYGHLDESFNGTDQALMTFSINNGEVQHDPGDVMLGMFEDLGWSIVSNPVGDDPEPTATATPIPPPTATNTLIPTATPTDPPLPTATNTPTPTSTNLPEPTATVSGDSTPTPVIVPTETGTPTATNTPSSSPTPTSIANATVMPLPTESPTPLPTDTPTASQTETPLPTSTALPDIPTETPIPPTEAETPDPLATIPAILTAFPTLTPTASNTPIPTQTTEPTPVPVSSCGQATLFLCSDQIYLPFIRD